MGYLKLNYRSPIDNLDACELEKLYLFPGQNNQGFGTKALNKVEELVHTMKKRFLVLYVLDTNQSGKSFYLRNGYHKIGTHQLTYSRFKLALRGLDLMSKEV